MKSFDEVKRAVSEFTVSLDKSKSYSLHRIKALLEALGDPQEKLKTVHIAGTSGKTSTAYYTAAMLQAAGYKVGLSASPYVEEINERVQLGTEPLSETVFCREFTEFFKILTRLSIKTTYFELFVAFAYWYYAKIKVDYAVIEVGLGGLLDGTNVVRRPDKICIITDIGLDHTLILGDTLAKVASQKAGIIQEHNHVFMYSQGKEVEHAITKQAGIKHAAVHYVEPAAVDVDLANFQKRNWLLAKHASEYIFERDGHKGLSGRAWLKTAKVHIPGRLEAVQYAGKTLILDGAHNTQKIGSLVSSFKAKYPKAKPAVLLAIGDNKQLQLKEMAHAVDGLAAVAVITTFKKGRDAPRVSIDPEKIAAEFNKASILIEPDLKKALKVLAARKEDLLLATGSLYLIGALKKELKEFQG